jgi:hypothetical protein
MSPIQAVAIAGSLGLLVIIVDLVRKRRLAEEYCLLWILVGAAFVAISVFRGLIERIASLLGIFYPPSAIFLIAIFFIVWLLLRFSLIVSDLAEKNRTLAQEIALLRLEVEEGRGGERAAGGPPDSAAGGRAR